MSRVLLVNLLQVAASSYAVTRGGAPERIVGMALLAAAIGTHLGLSADGNRFAGVEMGVVIVDLVLLIVLVIVALHADRRWVIWVAALHLLGAGAHLAEAVSPDTTRLAYAILSAAWSYPILILLAIGTLRHGQRLAAQGWDIDWSRLDPAVRRR